MAEKRRLTAIRSVTSSQFIANFTTNEGRHTEYVFTESRSQIRAIQACDRFGEDVGAFGYSHLVYKAVSAFRYAHQNVVDRPEGYESGTSYHEQPDTTSSLSGGTQAERRCLAAIRVAGPNHYVATFTKEEWNEQDYDFRVSSGSNPTVEESPSFREDIAPFANSNLVSKAVAAFHESHEKLVGRPDGYESRPSQSQSEDTDST